MPQGGHSAGSSLNERRFRDVGKFSGDEGTWSECSPKFRATIKECDVALFQALESAGESEIEVTKAHVESISMDRPLEKSAVLYNRLIRLHCGPALMLHQSAVEENGLEAWRLLRKRYDPKTTSRNLQLWLKIMNFAKVRKSQDVFVQVNRWESWVNTLKRDYQQDVAEKARVGLLIMMAPDELPGTFFEHADRLQNCAQVKEKKVMMLDARCRLHDPNAMDVGYAGEDSHCWLESGMENQDTGAVGRGDHCCRCGGLGHIANDCSTPKGKGKTKGVAEGLGRQAAKDGTRGRDQSGGTDKGEEKGTVT